MTGPFVDRGLATERTQLAWQRYAFAVAVVAILALRTGLRGQHEVAGFGVGFLLAGLAALLQVVGPRMRPRTAVRVVVATSAVAAVGSLVLALL